jgi:hypothetical protein
MTTSSHQKSSGLLRRCSRGAVRASVAIPSISLFWTASFDALSRRLSVRRSPDTASGRASEKESHKGRLSNVAEDLEVPGSACKGRCLLFIVAGSYNTGNVVMREDIPVFLPQNPHAVR